MQLDPPVEAVEAIVAHGASELVEEDRRKLLVTADDLIAQEREQVLLGGVLAEILRRVVPADPPKERSQVHEDVEDVILESDRRVVVGRTAFRAWLP